MIGRISPIWENQQGGRHSRQSRIRESPPGSGSTLGLRLFNKEKGPLGRSAFPGASRGGGFGEGGAGLVKS